MTDVGSNFPISGVAPIDGIFHEEEEKYRVLRLMAQQAEDYLRSFSWCQTIREAYFGGGYAGVVAVFLFRIVPSRPEVDEWLWVIVGDLPPAYLVIDASKTPSQALENYVWEMSKWIYRAKRGLSLEDAISVDLSPTWKNAEELETKLRILWRTIVPAFQASEVAPT